MKIFTLQRLLPAIISMAVMFLFMTSCDKDDPNRPDIHLPDKGATASTEEQKDPISRTKNSSKSHWKDQDNRSSHNFSTKGMTKGKYLLWTVEDGIAFNVMIDKTAAKDPTILRNITNGARTPYSGDIVENDKLYIANPSGAKEDFVVRYTMLLEEDSCIYVSCASSTLSGQDHRASDNFRFNHGCYKVECPDKVTFNIMEDVSGGKDNVVYTDVKNGSLISQVQGVGNVYVADVKNTSVPVLVKLVPHDIEWMKLLDDNTEFHSMSIPSTHDSGTYTLSSGMAKCQNFNFYDQLAHGIRCFDIRLDGSLKLCHGSGITYTGLGINLDDVLNVFNSWLENHNKETIIMMIKAESDEDHMRKSIADYFEKNTDKVKYILRGQKFPKLGAARGKIIMLRRFKTPDGESASSWGIDVGTGWPDDGTGQHTDSNRNMFIEDRYYDWTEAYHDTGEKKEDVYAALDSANNGNYSDYVFLIYNSVAGRLTHTPWEYAWGSHDAVLKIDPTMNDALSDNLGLFENKKKFRTGMLFMDFYNKHGYDDSHHLVERIINSNFQENVVPVP